MVTFQAYKPFNGKQIIKVTHVTAKEFETNPNKIWDCDVMMHGYMG